MCSNTNGSNNTNDKKTDKKLAEKQAALPA